MTLNSWKIERLKEAGLHQLYHVTRLENVPGILRRGLVPRNGLAPGSYIDISNLEVQDRRHTRPVPVGPLELLPSGHDMVPLFLTPRNPMTYVRRNLTQSLAVLVVGSFAICEKGLKVAFTDGNLAAHDTAIFWSFNNLNHIPWDVIKADRWTDHPDGSRKRCAEFLVAPGLPPAAIWKIDVPSATTREALLRLCRAQGVQQLPQVDVFPSAFFLET